MQGEEQGYGCWEQVVELGTTAQVDTQRSTFAEPAEVPREVESVLVPVGDDQSIREKERSWPF